MGNREALLQGALESLLAKGYARTTARDVAGRAGTSLAAIGYHFGSTERLLHEAIAEGFREWRGHMTEVLQDNSDASIDDLLALVARELASLFERERPLLLVFFEALAMSDRAPDVQAHAADLYREERVAIAAMIRAVRGDAEDDEAAAALLQAVVDGLIVQSVIGGDDRPDPARVLALLAPLARERLAD